LEAEHGWCACSFEKASVGSGGVHHALLAHQPRHRLVFTTLAIEHAATKSRPTRLPARISQAAVLDCALHGMPFGASVDVSRHNLHALHALHPFILKPFSCALRFPRSLALLLCVKGPFVPFFADPFFAVKTITEFPSQQP
jgi:hypothetical protein